MQPLLIALVVFALGYLLNIFYITVLYHRALTHKAVALTPFSTRLVAITGSWVTGIDPKAWACMHRLHHIHSDTELDPHSPIHQGVFGVAMGQLKSYRRTLKKLMIKDPETCRVVEDIPFDINFLNRRKLWYLPYYLHIGIGITVGMLTHQPIIGLAYFLGIMSHPIQGWLVNSLAHKFGYRNHDIPDHSRNNRLIALVVFGEGLQNNHHHSPSSACFAETSSEIDLGYWLCQLGVWSGLLAKKNVKLAV
jgi:stearoyl-CoA desaturase (delta-9 desaturase)